MEESKYCIFSEDGELISKLSVSVANFISGCEDDDDGEWVDYFGEIVYLFDYPFSLEGDNGFDVYPGYYMGLRG